MSNFNKHSKSCPHDCNICDPKLDYELYSFRKINNYCLTCGDDVSWVCKKDLFCINCPRQLVNGSKICNTCWRSNTELELARINSIAERI